MASAKQTFQVTDFSGGMNDKNANTLLAKNEGSYALNVVFGEKGIVKKREGLRKHKIVANGKLPFDEYGAPDGEIIINYFYFNGNEAQGPMEINNVYIIQTTSGNCFIYEDSLPNTASVTWRAVNFPPDLQPLTKLQFFQYGGNIYAVNSEKGGFKIEIGPNGDGTNWTNSVTAIPTMPKCDKVVIHDNRAFYTMDPKHPDYVYYSNLADPTNVNLTINDSVYGGTSTAGAGGILRVPTNQDIKVTGLISFQGALVIFKEDSVFTLSGKIPDEDWKIEKLSVSSGCVAPDTIALGNNNVYYLGDDGVYILFSPFQDQLSIKPISERVQNTINSFMLMEVDGEKLRDVEGMFATYHKGKYYLFSPNPYGAMDAPAKPDKPRPTRGVMFDELLNAWTTHDIDAKLTFIDKRIDKMLLFVDRHVYVLDEEQLFDQYPTGDEGIYALYTTQYYHLGKPHVTKRFRWLKIFFRPNLIPNAKVEIKIQIDYKDSFRFLSTHNATFIWGQSNWGESIWGPLQDQKDRLIRFGGSGGFIRFTFKNNVKDENLDIHGFTIGFKERNRVR